MNNRTIYIQSVINELELFKAELIKTDNIILRNKHFTSLNTAIAILKGRVGLTE